MVWQTFRWLLAADDLLDLYFHFRYDLEVWKGEDQTRSFAEFLGPGDYCHYMAQQTVWFGILNFLGCACLLAIPMEKVLKRIPAVFGIAGAVFGFFLFQNISIGYLGLGESVWISLPQWLYDIKVLTILGLPFPGFYSSDYFPVFPWIFVFLMGYYALLLLQKKPKLHERFYTPVPLLTKIGQKSLLIYLLHQPLCMVICAGVNRIMG